MLNVFFPSPPVPTISNGLYSAKSTGTRISINASRKPNTSSTEMLRIKISDEDADARRRAMHATKVQIGRSARLVGQEAVQLHGGIGMTMEYKGGHYFKRLTMIEMMFGNTDYHLRQLSKCGGLQVAA